MVASVGCVGHRSANVGYLVAMDYKEQQVQELEVLESIYPDELEVLNGEYPNVRFEVSIKLDLDAVGDSSALMNKGHTILARFQFSENYPDEAPVISMEAEEVYLKEEDTDEEDDDEEDEPEFDEHGNIVINKLENLSDRVSLVNYLPELQVLLEEQIENDMLLGMQMCFALISTIKDNCENWFHEQLQILEKEYDRRIEEREREEQAKFNGTKVTAESYLEWRQTFRKELGIDQRDDSRRLTAHNGKLTGKQMFEQGVDGTTDDSIDAAEVTDVDEIAESLNKSSI